MKLGKGELRIFFNAKGMKTKKIQLMEDKIKELVCSFGYTWWASSKNIVSHVRELHFEKDHPMDAPKVKII